MDNITKRLSAVGTRLSLLLLLMALLPNMASAQCPDNNHPHMIDLGLPSGTKWACCNVGATTPEGYGDYFAWGETQPKEVYDWSTYIHCDGSAETCHDIGSDIAGTEYDAATANWGTPWQMPSLAQCRELIANCTFVWTTENGIKGRKWTGPNGGSIFLPAAGYHKEGGVDLVSSFGIYWSSILHEWYLSNAYSFSFRAGGPQSCSDDQRYRGLSVRPVAAPSSDIPINETTFPDANFRNWVLSQTYGQDGVLTEAEIAGVTSIYVESMNIANLKGIEYFTELEYLNCTYNSLMSLDVSKNSKMLRLECALNQLTTLDVSNNTALTRLVCSLNTITTLDVSNNTALIFLACNNNQLVELNLSRSTALKELYCHYNQLTSLDLSKNTELTLLYCHENQLNSLDLSQNIALTELMCDNNKLTSLNISNNTALTVLACSVNQLTSLVLDTHQQLTELRCSWNQLTTLDVSKNTALTVLTCDGNQLTSLDVSKNTALTGLGCSYNQLTSLNVLNNTALTGLSCNNNRINETEMGNLVESLPVVSNGSFTVKHLDDANEQNVITTEQVATAKAKGWTVYAYDADWNWFEYEGDEPTLDPIDAVDFGSDIDGDTDLDGNVVGDIYYNISSGDGGYNVGEGCIVVTTPTDDSVIDGQDIFGEDFQAGFTGIVFKVPAGKGTIKVEAETTGTMVLKVKIGDAEPVTMELEGRLKVSFPYNVSEPTYVYIYGGTTAGAPDMAGHAAANGELKLYGIEVTSDETGISPIDHSTLNIEHYYTLDGRILQGEPTQKGVYIVNGHKVVIK